MSELGAPLNAGRQQRLHTPPEEQPRSDRRAAGSMTSPGAAVVNVLQGREIATVHKEAPPQVQARRVPTAQRY